MFRKLPRLYIHRRAMLLYAATIVAPVCALLWLGLQSFERQRQAVQTLTAERLDAAVDREARQAASAAFDDKSHPIARTFFVIDRGVVIEPTIRAPLPRQVPTEFATAERQELALRRPDLALPQYRALFARQTSPVSDSLALHFIARNPRCHGDPSGWRPLTTHQAVCQVRGVP